MNYMEELVMQDTSLEFVIPFDMGIKNFLSFSIKGLNPLTFITDDPAVVQISEIFHSTLLALHKLYADRYVFGKPILLYHPDDCEWIMKIGMLEKELFEKMKEPALNP